MDWELLVSFVALIISVIALVVSAYFWRRQFRPIVTASVRTNSGGNVSICYDLTLLNSGTIPARNVKIRPEQSSLLSAFGKGATQHDKNIWLACFEDDAMIPVLQNGQTISCSFGLTQGAEAGFWRYGASIDVILTYEGWFGRKFKEDQEIRVVDSASFTDFHWSEPSGNNQ